MERTRRTFLVGLGRFALGAAAATIVKPPVLYSFPSEIRIATPEEQRWVWERPGKVLDVTGWDKYPALFNIHHISLGA